MKVSDLDRLDLGIQLKDYLQTERLKLMILVQFYAGLRVSELIGITYKNLMKEEYNVNKDKKYQTIKISSDSAKFGVERIAYLPTGIYIRLLKWFKEKLIAETKYKLEDSSFIWDLHGSQIKVRRYSGLLNYWTKAILNESYNTHSNRHGRGTDLLLNENVPIEIVRDLLRAKGYIYYSKVYPLDC